MRLQLLSDLHLETETFDPAPAAGAEALVLAGDIDTSWRAFERFARWPVPVYLVAGNHEFDGREWNDAWPRLRAHAARSTGVAPERIPLGFTVGFEVDAVDGASERLAARGTPLLQPPHDEPWGQRTARFLSPSGMLCEMAESPWARELPGGGS